MKSKHDISNSSGDKYDSKNGGGDEDDSLSENGDRSRSTSRNLHERNTGKESKSNASGGSGASSSDKLDHDALSIYIGNVDYSATEEELRNTFIECGDIVRVTIIKNMKTGHPKGAAFIEFTDKEGVHAAMEMNGKQVKGRPLIVTSKKPRPENRQRDPRPHYHHPSYSNERRPMERSGPPMYSMYGPSGGRPSGPYSAGPSRGGHGYYGGMPSHSGGYYDSGGGGRRGPQMPMQMDPGSRYDPYRRPDFYDPYMMQQRGGQMQPQAYGWQNERQNSAGKMSSSANGNSRSNQNQHQPPVRYSNPYNRR